MNVIDTHNHLWYCQGEHFSWVTDSLSAIRRDFLIEDLLAVMNKNQVTGSILVQAIPEIGETEWLLDIANHTPEVKGVIGWVDICQGRAIETDIANLLQRSDKLKGIRYMSQGLPAAHLIDANFIEGVRIVGDMGLVYELLIVPSQLNAAEQLIAACPQTTFVIEHIAKPAIRDEQFDDWYNALNKIASNHKNVYCKLSGLVTEANYSDWIDLDQAYSELEPYFDAVYHIFGEDRLMFGSDWPVSLLAVTWEQLFLLYQQYLSKHQSTHIATHKNITTHPTNSRAEKLFHRIAEQVYSIK